MPIYSSSLLLEISLNVLTKEQLLAAITCKLSNFNKAYLTILQSNSIVSIEVSCILAY